MTGIEMRARLRGGERVYGTMVVADSPRWPQMISGLGLDFVFIDTEHVALDRQHVAGLCRAYAALGLAPVVRTPSPDPFLATMALDGGAQGVIAPYIETADQVRQLAGATKWRPLKGRRLQECLSSPGSCDAALREYLDQYNSGNVLIVNIESVPAIEALDEILSVPGLDAVLIGPHDLSVSLGVPEQYTHPAFRSAVETIITKARARGIGAGLHATSADAIPHAVSYAAMGANLFIHQGDIIAVNLALRRDFDMLKAALGDQHRAVGKAAGESRPAGNIHI